MNCFAETAVVAIKFPELRSRGASSPQALPLQRQPGLTKPICCAFVALKLRPVSSKIANYRIAQIPLQPRDAAESGNQAKPQFGKAETSQLVGDDQIANQGKLKSAAERDAVHRGDRGKRGGIQPVQHAVNALQKVAHSMGGLRLRPSIAERSYSSRRSAPAQNPALQIAVDDQCVRVLLQIGESFGQTAPVPSA